MIKKIIQLIKLIYVRISCHFCCQSNCKIELGRDNENQNENDKDE